MRTSIPNIAEYDPFLSIVRFFLGKENILYIFPKT